MGADAAAGGEYRYRCRMSNEHHLSILHTAAPAITGGLESVLVQLTSGLRQRGHDVRVALVLSPGTEEQHPVAEELARRSVPVYPIVVGTRSYAAERRAVKEIMLRMDADVLHTHGYRPDVMHGGIARSSHRMHAITLHGFVGGSRRGRFYEWLQIQAARRADAVIAVSEPIRKRLSRHGITKSVHLLRNALAAEASALSRSDAREALGLPQDMVIVGWVGRVSQEKGPDLFVRAMQQIPKAISVVIGNGPALGEVLSFAGASGMQARFKSTGMLPSASRYLAAFDILALTSRTEGTPMILLEAMLAGVPIVATRVGGVPQVLSANEAILCEPEPEQIAGAIRDAIDDSAGRERRAAAALSRARREFALDAWLDAHEAIYAGERVR